QQGRRGEAQQDDQRNGGDAPAGGVGLEPAAEFQGEGGGGLCVVLRHAPCINRTDTFSQDNPALSATCATESVAGRAAISDKTALAQPTPSRPVTSAGRRTRPWRTPHQPR